MARRAFGEAGPPDDVDFTTSEQIAVDVAQALTKGAIEQFLPQNAQRLGPAPPCPRRSDLPLTTEPQDLVIRGDTFHYDEPVDHCPACRRDPFPSPSPIAPGNSWL